MSDTPWLLYGAYGYTGRLIVDEARARGHRPTLAGRDAGAVRELAESAGMPWRAFSLHDADSLRAALAGHAAVLHAAGPFSATWEPMVEACLAAGCHYLDITGEIGVLEGIHARSGEAAAVGVHLVPGAGFDVVPTDCAAAQAAAACPGARRLDLAFVASGGPSRGTARTALEAMGSAGAVRRNGEIVPVRPGAVRRRIPFSTGERDGVAIAWGDVSTAWHTTGIPDIRVFMPLSPAVTRVTGLLAPLLRWGPARALARAAIDAVVRGPGDDELRFGSARVWAEALDEAGRTATVELATPNGYALTAAAAVRAVERVLGGQLQVEFGAHTPARAFGADFVFALPGVSSVRAPRRLRP